LRNGFTGGTSRKLVIDDVQNFADMRLSIGKRRHGMCLRASGLRPRLAEAATIALVQVFPRARRVTDGACAGIYVEDDDETMQRKNAKRT
jgi:hypothetical protein